MLQVKPSRGPLHVGSVLHSAGPELSEKRGEIGLGLIFRDSSS